MQVQAGSYVRTTDGTTAFVQRIDEKSGRAVIVFVEGTKPQGYATMRRLGTLEPLKYSNGRAIKVKNMKETVRAAKAGTLMV